MNFLKTKITPYKTTSTVIKVRKLILIQYKSISLFISLPVVALMFLIAVVLKLLAPGSV